MKKSVYTLLLSLLIVACGTEAETENQTTVTNSETIVLADTTSKDSIVIAAPVFNMDLKNLSYLLPEEVKVLKAYLNDSSICYLDYYIIQSLETTSDTMLIKSFDFFVSMCDEMNNAAQLIGMKNPNIDWDENGYPFNIQNDLSFLESAAKGFLSGCKYECSEYNASVELDYYITYAKKTSGTLDDEFFEMLQIANGYSVSKFGSKRRWFKLATDITGGSTIGNGIAFDFLSRLVQFQTKSQLGAELLDFLRLDVLSDIQHGIYYSTAAQVSAELEKIITGNFYSKEEVKPIMELKKKIASKDFSCDCVTGKMQFNCETADCNFGG